MAFVGELAGIATAVSWAVSSQMNGYMGRVVGAGGITLLRFPFQLCFLGLFCILGGVAVSFNPAVLGLLLGSAFTGLVIGDFALYKAITLIGARAAILLMSLSTCFTAVFGGLFLGEALHWQLGAGILLATGGVAAVVTERPGRMAFPGQAEPTAGEKRFGIILGFLCAIAIAASFILLRAVMTEGMSPLWAGFLRVTMAGMIMWPAGYALGWSQAAVCSLKQNRNLLPLLVVSCFLGGFGMWMACVTVEHVPAGVGATLIGLQPIWVIITQAVWTRTLPSLRVAVGAATAFSGTALVCLR